jgi:4-amino-4-deoxy-L-arabinose transferase-like glycosyltransferase
MSPRTLPAGGSRAGRVIESVARATAVVASVWFALVAAWGMFGPFPEGHFASNAATATTGENIWRWGIWAPSWHYWLSPPPKSEYFLHHPLLPFWLEVLPMGLFGHHAWAARLPAVLMSAATPPLLYKIAKSHWGVVAGAAAAAGFAVLPITLGFANFHNLEVAVIFGSVLFFYGHTRLLETGRTRWIVVSVLGAFCAVGDDWPGYFAVGFMLGWSFLRFVLPGRLFPRVKIAPYARWWAITAAMCAFTFVLWIYLFTKADKLNEFINMGFVRGPQEGVTIKQVLEARKYWIEIMFTPLAILIGKIALPVCILRALVFRRDGEIYSLAMFFTAAAQYLVFKKAADVHIFWPQYFGAYYALALAELVATVGAVVGWIGKRAGSVAGRAWGGGIALGLTLASALLLVPDGVRSLVLGRQTSGRYNNNGKEIRSEADGNFVLAQLRHWMTPRQTLDAYNSALLWSGEFALERPVNWTNEPPAPGPQNEAHPYWYGRASSIPFEALKKIAAKVHVRAYGDLWVVDERDAPAPIDAFAIQEREPNPFEWYFVSGAEVVRSISPAPDPFLTWEWRKHFDQPADPPGVEPVDLEQVRVAHNVAVDQKNADRAERMRERIDAAIDRTVQTRYDDGTRLIGIRAIGGAVPRLEVWFEAMGPTAGDAFFQIHSVVEAKNPWSLMPVDGCERNMLYAPSLPPHVWHAGFIYKVVIELMHRIGEERYFGYWWGRSGPAPKRTDGKPGTDLLVVR